MKKRLTVILILVISLVTLSGFGGCVETSTPDCIRIHIRANSNAEIDQSVKLSVKDGIVAYLTPLLAECESKTDAYRVMQNNLGKLEKVADGVLKERGYSYTARAALKKEEFPTRKYLDYTFPSGVYDALIIELGEGSGDNWWCVAFPPLCFVPENDDENFCYKSKLLEIIKKYYEVKNEK